MFSGYVLYKLIEIPMPDYAELELTIHQRLYGTYAIGLRFSLPENDGDNRYDSAIPLIFDHAQLMVQSLDPQAYGRCLSASLFADPALRDAFNRARIMAAGCNCPLRLRLCITPGASELHSLRLETLRDPGDDTPLSTSEHILFSRYLASSDWRPVRVRAKNTLRALVVVANPDDLPSYDLALLDVAGELARAQHGLGSISVTSLAASGCATLDKLVEPVRLNNARWREANLSSLQRQAALWQKEGRPPGLLFQRTELLTAEEWATVHVHEMTSVEETFLEHCREARRSYRWRKRANLFIFSLAVFSTFMDLDTVSKRACNLAGRNLTEQEWQRFFDDQPYHKTCPDVP